LTLKETQGTENMIIGNRSVLLRVLDSPLWRDYNVAKFKGFSPVE